MNQPSVYICPSHPSRWSQSTRLGFPESYSKFPLVIDFTYGSANVSKLLSQFVPPSPTVSTSLFSVCVSTAALQKIGNTNKNANHFSGFHIYVPMYYICFSLSDLTSLCIIGSRLIHLIRTDSNMFLS